MDAFFDHATRFPTGVFSVLLAIAVLYWVVVGLTGMGLHDEVEGASGLLEGLGTGAALLAWLGLGKVPASILLSLWSLFAWATSYLAMRSLGPQDGPMGLALGGLVGVGSLAVTAPALHMIAARLGPLFSGASAEAQSDLIGRSCRISTGEVDLGFGQARLEEGGDWRILQVRAEPGRLRRGDHALIIAFDEKLDAFRVEPLEREPTPEDI